jgi:membrane-associated phospholipid phosphatase
MDTSPCLPDAAWCRDAHTRMTTLWPVKALSNTLGLALFFIVYFWVMRHPQADVTVMPLTAVDRWVGFAPAAMPLYASLWLYLGLPIALLRTGRELRLCGVAALAMSTIGMAIFLFWPTTVPSAAIDWSLHPGVAFMKSVDAGANACPSLHAAFAVFTAVWLGRLLAEMRSGTALRALNWAWCLGILYSTLATRQHVALDLLAGAGLGLVVAVLHDAALRRPHAGAALVPVAGSAA